MLFVVASLLIWKTFITENQCTTLADKTPSTDSKTDSNQNDKVSGPPSEREWLKVGQQTKVRESTIPKSVTKVYIQKSGSFPTAEEMGQWGTLQAAHSSWATNNPGYKIQFFNLKLCRRYLSEHFHPLFLRVFDCFEAFAAKADFFRMLVVYAEGGWYSDWKQVALEKGLLDRLGQGVAFVGVWDIGDNYCTVRECVANCFFGAVPQHPLIALMIQKLLLNMQSESYSTGNALCTTGPCTFGQVMKNYVGVQDSSRFPLKMVYFQNMHVFEWKGGDRSILIRHKCEDCGTDQNWKSGNNYNEVFLKNFTYCSTAQALFLE
jgi:hypothetical protein